MKLFDYIHKKQTVTRPRSKVRTVSIVIPAFNEAERIEACLDSCLSQTVIPEEVVVVNNMSTDSTEEIVKRYIKRHPYGKIICLIHQNKQQGIAPTRNAGFDAAQAQIIGRIDADSILDSHWVETVKHIFQDPKLAAATGPVLYHDMPARRIGLKVDAQIRKTLDVMALDHKFLFGSNMAITKQAWNAIKGDTVLDLENNLHEDVDLALCLYKKGLKIKYASDMVGGMSARRLDDSPKEFFNYVMRFECTLRHHGIESLTSRMPIFIYLSTYFPIKLLRSLYDPKAHKFTSTKLKSLLISRIRSLKV